MAFKPFKPPSLKLLSNQSTTEASIEPSVKRRKISPGVESPRVPRNPKELDLPEHHVLREPLHQIHNCSNNSETVSKGVLSDGKHFAVLWRKFTQKKNKTWDDDGYLSATAGQATLYDSKGKRLGQGPFQKQLETGTILSIAGRDVEIGDSISKQDFLGAVGTIKNGSTGRTDNCNGNTTELRGQSEPLLPRSKQTLKDQLKSALEKDKTTKSRMAPNQSLSRPQRLPFKQPLKENTVLPQIPSETPIPRHDPNDPGSVVFKRPKSAPPGHQIVDVVLDPLLSKHLRDHQQAGVKFLYECVMGLRDSGGDGCILADDMGLGKTLQTIALLWTLIKQNPIHRAEPVVKKALIVCPVSLIQNWKKEFRKWLGRDRLGVLAFDDKGSHLGMFDGRTYKVMIVGYERLRTIAEDLTKGAGIDIVVCDEGHRLKTLQNKSAKAIESLNTSRRIILSGTPIQNDLSEFFAMANFVNDGILGTYKSFVKHFENPIMKSRQPNASEDDIEKGEMASEELAKTTSTFILRRTADILSKYLPPKTEYVLFCKPTPEQGIVYRQVLHSPMFQNALGSSEAALQLITILKKLCNSPALMRPDRGNDESTSSSSLTLLNEMLPAGLAKFYSNRYATKIRLLDELLQTIRKTTNDKVILVSNYTSTLNLMAQLLENSGGSYLRLDGSTPQGKRQGLVDEFNHAPSSACFAFLLSAKAGGMGLNLIGANRLVLFDVDWNPATDDQAMARIHREGQRKHCKIYRFIIKGGLEERIWQRQVVKRGLADSIIDGRNSGNGSSDFVGSSKKGQAAFSREELRDLFRLDEKAGLRTHDLIGCECGGSRSAASNASNARESSESLNSGSSDEEELPDISSLIKASDLSNAYLDKQERIVERKSHPRQAQRQGQQDQEKQELMKFEHLDTSGMPELDEVNDLDKLDSLDAVIDDECLMNVLKLGSDVITGRVAYLFKKTTGPVAENLQD